MRNNNFLNKITDQTKEVYNLFDADFWFGKEENRAHKKIINQDMSLEKKEETELGGGKLGNNFLNINFQDLKKNSTLKTKEALHLENVKKENVSKSIKINHEPMMSSTPAGYIKLFLENTNTNELFIKHNITLKYIQIENNLFIKSVLLVNDDRELDCFSVGENESLTITKENNSILKLSIRELNGNTDQIMIVNGRVVV